MKRRAASIDISQVSRRDTHAGASVIVEVLYNQCITLAAAPSGCRDRSDFDLPTRPRSTNFPDWIGHNLAKMPRLGPAHLIKCF